MSNREESCIVCGRQRNVNGVIGLLKRCRSSLRLSASAVRFSYSSYALAAILTIAAWAFAPGFANATTAQRVKVGIVEELGHHVPMNLTFKDSEGHDVTLNKVANGKPLIIDMAYYECPGICDVVMGGLKQIVDNMSSKVLGQDFNIATISFNSADKPADAMKKKQQFWGTMQIAAPASSWRFLTGDSANIYALTNALGFYFMRDNEDMFMHPTALIVVDKNGKIIRYIQGTNFALADMKMALDEAAAGTPEQIVSSSPKVCFSHDPSGYKLTDSILRYGGAGTMAFVVGFLAFLRKKKKFGRNQRDAV